MASTATGVSQGKPASSTGAMPTSLPPTLRRALGGSESMVATQGPRPRSCAPPASGGGTTSTTGAASGTTTATTPASGRRGTATGTIAPASGSEATGTQGKATGCGTASGGRPPPKISAPSTTPRASEPAEASAGKTHHFCTSSRQIGRAHV